MEKIGPKKNSLYVQDKVAPVGYRLAAKHPEHVNGLVVQNGNVYEEGLDNDFWMPLKADWKSRMEENAKIVAFLASDEASYITGVELNVDGGLGQL